MARRSTYFAPVICVLCDNARALELLNHLRSTAKKLGRICDTSHGSVCGDYKCKIKAEECIGNIVSDQSEKGKMLRTLYGLHEKHYPLCELR
uniref:Uncharacterized protein n=1 Tax=Amphimedon queenslandica TaxID=400682 RepID=A0A1X7U4V9_AMPQE